MNINIPFPSISNNSFHKKPSSVFTPTIPSIFSHPNISIYDTASPNFINGWNKYQNLYSQIILRDKTALNIKKMKKPKTRYKTSLSNIKVIYNEASESNQTSNDDDNDKNNNESFSNKKSRGRKKKDVIEKGNHTKFTDDNMMRKIKCHFFNHINNSLNNSLTDKKLVFLKLDNLINENLKRDYNMELMNKTIKDIYLNSKISNKYKNRKNDSNKELVERIYSENKETDTIKILEKEYIELFTELMENNIDKFCNEILNKEEKNGLPHEQTSVFFDKMKRLCNNYKDWFEMKRGRERKNVKV